MIDGFWKLLEDIANSGEIRVCEGFSFSMRSGKYISEPSVKFDVVLDLENARNAYKLIDDVFTHPYDNTPKSYRWEEGTIYSINIEAIKLDGCRTTS